MYKIEIPGEKTERNKMSLILLIERTQKSNKKNVSRQHRKFRFQSTFYTKHSNNISIKFLFIFGGAKSKYLTTFGWQIYVTLQIFLPLGALKPP